MELFDWLKTLYEIWKNLDAEVIRLFSLTGMGELMKHGCTTCFDHHYVFPKDTGDLLGAQFGAADELGIRMYASRGHGPLGEGRRPAAGQRGADGRRDHGGFRARHRAVP